MKPAELRNLSQEELQKKIRDTREELLQKRLKKKTAALESPAQFRVLRRSIARMETIAGEKRREASAAKKQEKAVN